jgi:hypothetical protein
MTLHSASPHNSHPRESFSKTAPADGAVGNEIEMSEPIECSGLTTAIGNLVTLANVFRDERKYIIASALYRRAIEFLEGMNPSEANHALLAKILDDQSFLQRKMSCGQRQLKS